MDIFKKGELIVDNLDNGNIVRQRKPQIDSPATGITNFDKELGCLKDKIHFYVLLNDQAFLIFQFDAFLLTSTG